LSCLGHTPIEVGTSGGLAACETSRAIDLRTLDRRPLASVDTLVLGFAVLLVSGMGADAEAVRAAR
jgi:hypothetical protein